MTARVTTLKGADAGLYYVEALPSYYLDTGEPAGRWQGRGADLLGLRGEIEDADFLDVMAGIHPRSGGATLGRAYGEESVRGFDITASAPKSVSTLFALGDPFVRAEVLAAHDAAVAAMVVGSRTTPIPATASTGRFRSSTPRASSPRPSANTPHERWTPSCTLMS